MSPNRERVPMRGLLQRGGGRSRSARSVRRMIICGAAVGLTGCASGRARNGPEVSAQLVTGPPVTRMAVLSTLHVSDSVRVVADSALGRALRQTCPTADLLSAADTEEALRARGIVIPRRLSDTFAREARAVLGVDLLLSPTVLGLTYDTRDTFAGVMDALIRPWQLMNEAVAGMALEGWDLRTAQRSVWVVRTHASSSSWLGHPARLLQNATTDAVRQLAPLCATAVTTAR